MKYLPYDGQTYGIPESIWEHLQRAIGWKRGWYRGETLFGPVWIKHQETTS